MKPILIEGGTHSDTRGKVTYINDFKFVGIERFYVISNSEEHPIRAWQGHKLDCKNFFCIQGSFKVSYVKIDNWESPSLDLKVESVILDSNSNTVLRIPAGYANAIQSLEKNSRLMSFSTLPLDKVKEDDVRFHSNTWSLDGE